MVSSSLLTLVCLLLALADGRSVPSVKRASGPFVPEGGDWGHIETGIIPNTTTFDLSFIGRVAGQLNKTSTTPHPGSLPSPLEKRGIIGPDGRYQFTSSAYPYRAVGRLNTPTGICSGSLVGPRLALTARHCATDNGSYQFLPGYDNGASAYGSANVINKYLPDDPATGPCHVQQDFAVLLLDRRIGDDVGWLAVGLPDTTRFGQPFLTSMGYPGDRDGANRPYRQDGISVSTTPDPGACTAVGPLYSTDSDAEPGQSGSPLWDNEDFPTVWGVWSTGEAVNGVETWNGYASGEDMFAAVEFLRNAGG